MTKVQAIECPFCGYILYSRARHDFRYCQCESCFIDGGFDYPRYGGPLDQIKKHDLEVPLTRQELYDDWNNRTDRYGLIAPCGPPLSSMPCAAPPQEESHV
jgi:hypothetical protein